MLCNRSRLVADEASCQSNDGEIRRHTANIRQAADGLDSLAGQIKEPRKTKESSDSRRGTTYEPENEKT